MYWSIFELYNTKSQNIIDDDLAIKSYATLVRIAPKLSGPHIKLALNICVHVSD